MPLGDSTRPTGPGLPDSVRAAPPGSRVGKFVRVEKLGAGGGGEVWKAWDTALDRWVALKFLKSGGPDELARFQREAQLAGKLGHPNIAAIYEISSDPSQPFIAMQFVDGKTLRSSRGADLPLVARLLRDAARAVHAAHEQGVIHRDLKPDNLMTSTAGQLMVMDFGLARGIEGNASVSGSVVGTPAYMPPEQARGERVDARADVYSLGATLYELLTGRRPFDGATVYEILGKVESGQPTAPRRLDARIPPDLETIVLKCLEKDRVGRYATAADLADDLDRWLNDQPVLAQPPGFTYRLAKGLARRRGLLLVAAIALLGVGGVFVGIRLSLTKATAETATAEKSLVGQMRRTSDTCLKAALDLRRAGNVKGMEDLARQVRASCEDVARSQPTLAEPHYLLGRFYRAQMKWDDALREQDEALKLDSSHAAARFERGLLRIRAYDREIERLRDQWCQRNTTMVRPARRTLVMDPPAEAARQAAIADLEATDQPLARALVGWIHIDPATLKRLGDVTAADPDFSEAWEWLARTSLEGGFVESAERQYTAALERDRGYVPHFLGRAQSRFALYESHLRRGERKAELLDGAFRDLDEAVVLMPGLADAWMRRGEVRATATDHGQHSGVEAVDLLSKAAADFDEAIRLDPSRSLSHSKCGMVRTKLGTGLRNLGRDPGDNYARALASLDEAIRLDPTSDAAFEQRGAVRYNWADWRRQFGEDPEPMLLTALDDCERAAQLNSARQWNWGKLGEVRILLAEVRVARRQDVSSLYDDAVAALEKAVKLAPENHLLAEKLGVARLGQGDTRRGAGRDPSAAYEAAITCFDASLRLFEKNIRAYEGRGMARIGQAKWLEQSGGSITALCRAALDDFTKGIAVQELPSLYCNRALIRTALGEPAVAASDYRRALEIAPKGWPHRSYVEGMLKKLGQ